MKKRFITHLSLGLSSMLLIGCMGASPSTEHIVSGHMTQSEVCEAIKNAGEKEGWRMTEFRSNTLIAEKVNGSDTQMATVTFSTSSFEVSAEEGSNAGGLEDAIEEALH